MNLKEAKAEIISQLEIQHSRAVSESIRDFIGTDKIRVKALVEIIASNDLVMHQRAFYAMSVHADTYPEMFLPHFKKLFSILAKPLHDGFGRIFTRYLSQIDIPQKWLGHAADYCFTALEDPKTPIAIQAHSMSVLLNIGKKEPDILPELAAIINANYEHNSSGVKSRARKVLKEINRILDQ